MTGQSSRHTGDINLAAALMACAISLNRTTPVRVVLSDFQKPYASWYLEESSTDGQHITEHLMNHWSRAKLLPDGHPFDSICRFIAAKPEGKLTPEDWLAHAVDYLRGMGVALPGLRRIDDIRGFVEKIPTAPESYILAFVANRSVCLDLYQAARRAIYQTRDNGGIDAHTMIDSGLPQWKKTELLSRLQG